jgi:MFS family permease
MTTLGVHTAYWQSAVWLAAVGVGSGMFNSPNTAAMMGVVPAHRRGVAAGARTLLQNTGAVLSIAFVMAIVTSAIPKATLFAIFSGVATGLSAAKLDPFIANMHVALWVLAAVSFAGTGVCLLRPSHRQEEGELPAVEHVAEAAVEESLIEAAAGESFIAAAADARETTAAAPDPTPPHGGTARRPKAAPVSSPTP